jgi:hypothetical protein
MRLVVQRSELRLAGIVNTVSGEVSTVAALQIEESASVCLLDCIRFDRTGDRTRAPGFVVDFTAPARPVLSSLATITTTELWCTSTNRAKAAWTSFSFA